MITFASIAARYAIAAAAPTALSACVSDKSPTTSPPAGSTSPALAAATQKVNEANATKLLLARAGVTTVNKVVQSGIKSSFMWTVALNPDCSSAGDFSMQVSLPPKHGSIVLEPNTAYSTFPANNPRAHCNAQKTRGWSVFYTSESGYKGDDIVGFDLIDQQTSTPRKYLYPIKIY